MCLPGTGYGPLIDDKPCNHWFGNLCTGMGNPNNDCMGCGWPKYDHSPYREEFERLLRETAEPAPLRPTNGCEHSFQGHGERTDRCQYCDIRRDQWEAQFGPEPAPGAPQ